ncbi:MAG: 50S ribosomal protein L25/general stress protein Ctc [Bacteroidota bacterium]
MESIAISGNVRTDLGKKHNKALRRNGDVPCVIYGGDEVVHFSSPERDFKSLIYTPDFKLVDITVDGKKYECILKDIQFHPVTDEILHIDFLRLIPGRKIKVEIPIKFKGEAPGVKEGGKLMQKVRRVMIKTTPDKVVDELFVDVSELNLGHSVRVRDVQVEEGMEIMNALGIPVASVETPRALRSATSASAEDALAGEGEIE